MILPVTQYPEHYFCWVDVETPDPDAAKDFYATTFGWEFESPESTGDYHVAALFNNAVCGLSYSSSPTAHWNSYIKVDNAQRSSTTGEEIGASVQQAVNDIGDLASVAELTDPTGAVFRLWQANQLAGAGIVNQPQTWIWNHLFTRDLESTEHFYADLFGWTSETESLVTGDQTYFRLGDRLIAGMMQMSPKYFSAESEPYWGVCFRVYDCDATVDLARSAGGEVLIEPQNVPNVGRLATILDPQGGKFQVLKTNIYDPAPGTT